MPRNAIGVHRPYSWAKYLTDFGAKVTVVTAEKHSFDEPLDLVLPELKGVEVIEVPYGLKFSVGNDRNSMSLLLKWLLPSAKKVRNMLRKSLGLRIDPRDGWCRASLKIVENLGQQADVVISTFGPRSAHLLAAHMKVSNPDLLWVADYRDLWSQGHHLGLNSKAKNRERKLELESVGKYADIVTTVSAELAHSLSDLFDRAVNVVMNGFDISSDEVARNLSRDRSESVRAPLRIAYTGMIYEGRQEPTALFNAIRELMDEGALRPGDLIVDFYGARQPGISNLASAYQIDEFVRVHGHVKREKALDAQRNADALLLLEDTSPEAKGVLTGKLFEYLSAGVPIICLGGIDNSAIERVLNFCGSGISLGKDVGLVKQALLDLISSRHPVWFRPEVAHIMEYSRESQARIFREIIDFRIGRS